MHAAVLYTRTRLSSCRRRSVSVNVALPLGCADLGSRAHPRCCAQGVAAHTPECPWRTLPSSVRPAAVVTNGTMHRHNLAKLQGQYTGQAESQRAARRDGAVRGHEPHLLRGAAAAKHWLWTLLPEQGSCLRVGWRCDAAHQGRARGGAAAAAAPARLRAGAAQRERPAALAVLRRKSASHLSSFRRGPPEPGGRSLVEGARAAHARSSRPRVSSR